jgi:hypothetical protein
VRLFRRAPRPADLDDARVVSHVVMFDDAPDPEARRRLLRAVAEAVVLQDRAVEVLADMRNREPLDEVAQRAGPLARRFHALRDELPVAEDGVMQRQCATASVVLDHHGRVLVHGLELLAAEWRSERIVEQLERLDGLGAPAERLDALYAELAMETSSSA